MQGIEVLKTKHSRTRPAITKIATGNISKSSNFPQARTGGGDFCQCFCCSNKRRTYVRTLKGEWVVSAFGKCVGNRRCCDIHQAHPHTHTCTTCPAAAAAATAASQILEKKPMYFKLPLKKAAQLPNRLPTIEEVGQETKPTDQPSRIRPTNQATIIIMMMIIIIRHFSFVQSNQPADASTTITICSAILVHHCSTLCESTDRKGAPPNEPPGDSSMLERN